MRIGKSNGVAYNSGKKARRNDGHLELDPTEKEAIGLGLNTREKPKESQMSPSLFTKRTEWWIERVYYGSSVLNIWKKTSVRNSSDDATSLLQTKRRYGGPGAYRE